MCHNHPVLPSEPPESANDEVECPNCTGLPFTPFCETCQDEGYITRSQAEKLRAERKAEES